MARPASLSRHWQRILQQLVEQGQLLAAVLTDFQGLPFAASLAPLSLEQEQRQYLIETLAAFTPPLLRQGKHLEGYLGTFRLDEVVIRTQKGVRVVARLIETEDMPLILTVLVAPRRPYRRAMNKAVRALIMLGGGQNHGAARLSA